MKPETYFRKLMQESYALVCKDGIQSWGTVSAFLYTYAAERLIAN